MEFIAIAIMVVLALVAAFFFKENASLHKQVVSLDEQLREAQHTKSSPSKSSKSDKQSEKTATVDPELERDLDDARTEIKDLKKQVYDLKSESKGLKKQLKDATTDRPASTAPDSEMLFELREQIAELSTENARLEDALEEARSRRPAPKPEPPKEKKPEPPPAAAASASAGADTASLREKYDKEIAGLRDELRDLNRKLKSTASNVDKQRRRADNNDRAYKITQRQYDAAQERVTLLEAQLERAGVQPVPAAELVARTPEHAGEVKRVPALDEVEEERENTEVLTPTKTENVEPRAAADDDTTNVVAPKGDEHRGNTEIITPAPAEPPPMPGAMVRKQANKPKPEVGSTTVLSPMALATASTNESDSEAKEEESGETTLHRAKPITAADLSGAIPRPKIKPPPRPKSRDSEEFDSGGHTAMLTPGALANSVTPAEEKSEPTADESGGHTAVLSAATLSKAVTGEQSKPDLDESSDPRQTGERTAILSASAFSANESEASDAVAEAEPKAEEPPDEAGGRRPSAGLFGMPDDVFKRPEGDKEDEVRSTQFAFPTQMDTEEGDEESGGTARFAPEGSGLTRLGGGLKGDDNPADKPVPDAESEGTTEKDEKRLGGRLGDLDLGDLGSAIDDAWGDLDID